MTDLLGKKDAIKIRNRYQSELNDTHHRIKKKVEFFYRMNHKLKYSREHMVMHGKNIDVDIEKKSNLISELAKLLEKTHLFEKEQLKTRIQKNKNIKSLSINQKFKYSDIDDMNYNTMMDIFKFNPKTEIKESADKYRHDILKLQENISNTKKLYNEAFSWTVREIEYFPRNIIEARNIIKKYDKILEEGNNKLSTMRYIQSVFYRLSTESNKLKVKLDTINHRINEFTDTIDRIEKEVESAKKEIESVNNQ